MEPILRKEGESAERSFVTEGYVSSYVLDNPRQRKTTLPPWSVKELMVLIAASKAEFVRIAKRSRTMVWGSREQRIAEFLAKKGLTNSVRDFSSCDDMWEILTSDFGNIYSYDRLKPSGGHTYYHISVAERRLENSELMPIPDEFPRKLYDAMASFLL